MSPTWAPFTTPPEFFTDEWDKVTAAWRGFNPTERDLFIEGVARDLRAQGKLKNLPEIPDWDRIIKLGQFGPQLTPEEMQERKQRMARAIATSPIPREVRALGSLANALDDAQDLGVFISLIGRIAVHFIPLLAGPLAVPLSVVTKGTVILNALTALTNAVAIGQGLRSAGALGAAAQAVGSHSLRIMLKNEVINLLRLAARKGVALTPVTGTFAKIVRKGDILQSLQATDTLFGVGISLGAIMGYFLNLAYSVVDLIAGPRIEATRAILKDVNKELPPEYIIIRELSQQKKQF